MVLGHKLSCNLQFFDLERNLAVICWNVFTFLFVLGKKLIGFVSLGFGLEQFKTFSVKLSVILSTVIISNQI